MLFCPMLLKMRSHIAIMTPQQQQSAFDTERLWRIGSNFSVRCARVHAVFAPMVRSIWGVPWASGWCAVLCPGFHAAKAEGLMAWCIFDVRLGWGLE